MSFTIKKVRPLFTGVITTARRYVSDQTTTKGGLLVDTTKMVGTMNPLQWVVSVGSTVHDLKEGDIVKINFKRYIKAKHVPGIIGDDNVQSDNLSATFEIPSITIDGVDYLFIQNNDIEYVVTEYDGIDEGGLLE